MSFRKIDVDAYDEDVLQETELYDPDPRPPPQVLADAKQKQLAVRSALNKLRPLLPDRDMLIPATTEPTSQVRSASRSTARRTGPASMRSR